MPEMRAREIMPPASYAQNARMQAIFLVGVAARLTWF
jgi:hypothetical protein